MTSPDVELDQESFDRLVELATCHALLVQDGRVQKFQSVLAVYGHKLSGDMRRIVAGNIINNGPESDEAGADEWRRVLTALEPNRRI